MAFDKPTRNRLAKFVSDARRVIADEFTEQFQSLFGISATGEIAPLNKLGHLDDAGLATAERLRDRIDYLIKNHPHDKDRDKVAVERLAREQAFTILNRLAAIRMAEKRGLIVESVGQGYQSKGFKVFETVAGSALGDTYHRYRRYLFCLFDELAIDLGILFDRRSPLSLLFPREPALLELLDLLDAPDLQDLWAEDETVGWIYQYYNDEAERKKMREESSAPRNSRELAVRNQFFTPRYVVEFLTDNTLGRLWYEMTRGETALRDRCRYLVRRPTEIFLKPGESAPGEERAVGSGQKAEDNLSQEDLLKQPVYIPYRALKDPREIRLLDPACGSMHFGLYAFDLFEIIYGEAWDLQVDALNAVGSGQPAAGSEEDYGNIGTQLPGLDRVAESHGSGRSHLHHQSDLPEGGTLRPDQSDSTGSSISALEHRRRTGSENDRGIPAIPVGGARLTEGSGNPDHDRPSSEVHSQGERGFSSDALLGSGTPHPRSYQLLGQPVTEAEYNAFLNRLRHAGWNYPPDSAFRPLPTAYSSREDFLKSVPKMIVERNIHGIDIDPRAAQIAGLSLWLRAQRAWHQAGVKPADRPRITRSNLVCAEPMPGEKELLREFVEQQFPAGERPVFLALLESIFDKMQLAGEAGSLLRIEEEIKAAIETARSAWEKLLARPAELFSSAELSQTTRSPDLPGLDPSLPTAHRLLPTAFWQRAEQRIYDALEAYAEQAENGGGFQRRLFADDAAQGFAFIDLCRKRYDVVVMNPPFGKFSKLWTAQSKAAYPNSSNDILGAFVERFLHILNPSGHLGAITSRTCFFLGSFKNWRLNVVLKESAIRAIADLGQGVMDNAMVEAAAYVLEKTTPTSGTTIFRSIAEVDRQTALEACIDAHNQARIDERLFLADQAAFHLLPDSPFVYWIDGKTIRQFKTGKNFEPDIGNVRVGLQTGDDPRFVRAVWEVASEDTIFCYYPTSGEGFCRFDDPIVQEYFCRRNQGTPRWAFHVKSGASQPWYSPITLKLNFAEEGAELRNFKNDKGKLKSALRSVIFYHRAGFSWTRRAVRLYPYAIPGNCIPSVSRYMAFPDHGLQSEAIGVCASRLVSAFLRFYGEKFEFPNFLVDTLKSVPWPELQGNAREHFESLINREVKLRRLAYQNHEPFHDFLLPVKVRDFSNDGRSLAFDPTALLDDATEQMVAEAYGFSEEQARTIERDLLEAINYQRGSAIPPEDTPSIDSEPLEECEAEGESEGDDDSDFVLDYSPAAIEEAHISYLIGAVFGRWDIRYATGERPAPELPDPFAPLPVCPPGLLQGDDGLPLSAEEGRRQRAEGRYPLDVAWDGILVDDPEHPLDLERRVHAALDAVGRGQKAVSSGQKAVDRENGGRSDSAYCPPPTAHSSLADEACALLGVPTLREWFRRPAGFFADHLKRYSKSRRQAPIYWPLSTKSGRYTLWLYYHRLTDQTLHTCLADFLDPKLRKVQAELDSLSGQSGTRAGELRELLDELKDLHQEIERIIKLPWRPNLNDGVLITASPLWKLFRLPKWQKELKACWEKLAKGDYDWAHLAHTIWPSRVEKACETDRSLAIAHGLEHLCKIEPPKPKKKRAKKNAANETDEADEPKLIEED